MGFFSPTEEQERAAEAFLRGQNLRIIAVAGSGKTTTLSLMAQSRPKEFFLYLSFNRALKEEAEAKMPRNVRPMTLHSLAYREEVRGNPLLEAKLRRGDGNIRTYQIVEALGEVSPTTAYLIKETLDRFLRSWDKKPSWENLPPGYRRALKILRRESEAEAILEAASLLWKKMQDLDDPFPISHDAYVKMWAQKKPKIRGAEALLVDEAQDLDPVLARVLEGQEVQRVYVGDPNQQIYAWRGAVDALSRLSGEELTLSQTFRFSEGLAQEVRLLMEALGREIPIYGRASHASQLGEVKGEIFTVLTRTNAGIVDALVELDPPKAHVVGGVDNLLWLLRDAEDLRLGRKREKPHPDLMLVQTWKELESLASLGEPNAVILVKLASRYKNLEFLAWFIAQKWTPVEAGHSVFSTTHKAKGREWDQVLIWEDFPDVWRKETRERLIENGGPHFLREEINLLYVAVTRARKVLEPSGELGSFWRSLTPTASIQVSLL